MCQDMLENIYYQTHSYVPVAAAGILPPSSSTPAASNPFSAPQAPRITAPPARPANPNWIKF